MFSSVFKFNNLISPTKGKITPLHTVDLPGPLPSALYNTIHDVGLKTGNSLIISALNPHNIPRDKIVEKVIDVQYSSVKNKNILLNTYLDHDLPVGATKILRLKLDKTNSTYFKEGSLNTNFVDTYISVLNEHPIKCTRLGNGKIKLTHITHNPTDMNNFIYISNKDLYGKIVLNFYLI